MAATDIQSTYIIPHEITTEELNESYYVIRDLVAGTAGGFAICLSGHPFDTIKVRMQMTQLSLTNCIRLTMKNEGIKSFYKGVQSPFYTVPVINAVVFGSYGFCHRLMGQDIYSEFTMKQGLYAGAFAGLVNSIVLSPVELIKCRMQMDVQNKFRGALHCMSSIYNVEGVKI
jgi:solute carrier family 25 carnitine/acylcarnitine transporter 20/29